MITFKWAFQLIQALKVDIILLAPPSTTKEWFLLINLGVYSPSSPSFKVGKVYKRSINSSLSYFLIQGAFVCLSLFSMKQNGSSSRLYSILSSLTLLPTRYILAFISASFSLRLVWMLGFLLLLELCSQVAKSRINSCLSKVACLVFSFKSTVYLLINPTF